MFLVGSIVLAGCADTKIVESPTPEDDTAGPPATSPWEGDWTGTIDGHASFETDWETAPYCSGEVSVAVGEAGLLEGGGDCVILWGPYEGLGFDATLSGSITEEGAVVLIGALLEGSGDHAWDDADLAGIADSVERTATAQGDTLYYPTGMEAIDAFMVLGLSY